MKPVKKLLALTLALAPFISHAQWESDVTTPNSTNVAKGDFMITNLGITNNGVMIGFGAGNKAELDNLKTTGVAWATGTPNPDREYEKDNVTANFFMRHVVSTRNTVNGTAYHWSTAFGDTDYQPGDADQCNSEDNRNLFVGLNYTGSAYTNNWTTNTFVVGADGYDLEMRDAYRLNANEYYFVAKATSCSGTSSICVGKVDNSPSVSGQIVSFNSENLIPYCVASHNGYVYVGGWKNGLNAKAFIVKLDPTNNYNPVAYVELYDDNNGAVWDIRPIDGKICAVGHIKKPGSSEYQKGHITTLDNDLNVLHNLIIQENAGFNMQIKGLDKYCQNEIVVAGNYRTSSSSDRSPWMSRFTISEEGVVSPAFESCGQVPVYAYPHTGDDYALNVVYDANNEKVMMVNESISGSAISAHVIQADGELLSGCETQLSVNFEVYNEDVEAYTTTFFKPTLPALSNYTGLDVDDAHLGTVSSDCTQGSMPNQETMGIENSKEMDHTMEVFPNPATNMLSVQSNESGTARIIGLDGREVLSGIQMISGKTEVNISALHPGEYILQFVGTSSVTTTKFIKR